jgi:hypothetical protein
MVETAAVADMRRSELADASVMTRLLLAAEYASHVTDAPNCADEPTPLVLPLVQLTLPGTTCAPAKVAKFGSLAVAFRLKMQELDASTSAPHAQATAPKDEAGKATDVPPPADVGQ